MIVMQALLIILFVCCQLLGEYEKEPHALKIGEKGSTTYTYFEPQTLLWVSAVFLRILHGSSLSLFLPKCSA